MNKLVLHVVLNSHLDPVWLWSRSQGEDAVIATARTTCDILDDYPQVHITRGESWFYETVERLDPATFVRLKAHIAAGRLHVVGGWYVQPDCNLASPFSYRLHGEIAGAYFQEKFGVHAKTGYNVDSFGHAATLPDFYAAAGIENYLFMRPGPHEKNDLPGEVFHWRSPSGASLLAARIPVAYCTHPDYIEETLGKVLSVANRDLGHALFLCGVGDHGGGPTRAEIDYLLAHLHDRPDVEIRFSHPDAFFEAIRASDAFASLPTYEGELQHHAIGCYTAFSPIKRQLRQTEILLERSRMRIHDAARRAEAEKDLLFATFHDALAGTCTASAYGPILDALAAARHIVEEAEIEDCRKATIALPPSPRQRAVLDNLGDEPYEDLVEIEPWILEKMFEEPTTLRVLDTDGNPVPFQSIPMESITGHRPRIAFPVSIPAHQRAIFELDQAGPCEFSILGQPERPEDDPRFPAIDLKEYDDTTDTWSHGLRGYDLKPKNLFIPLAQDTTTTLSGPLVREDVTHYMDPLGNHADIAMRTVRGFEGIRLRIRLVVSSPRTLIKLAIKPRFKITRRTDGIPGGSLQRALDGEEFPLFNYTLLEGANQKSLAVVSADVFAADVSPSGTLSLTLLRTPYFAHHDPTVPPPGTLAPVTDLGEHFFDIALLYNPTSTNIQSEIYRQTNPLRFTETTLGMGH